MALDWSAVREAIPVSRSGASVFLQLSASDTLVPALSAGQSLLHQSICLPQLALSFSIKLSLEDPACYINLHA